MIKREESRHDFAFMAGVVIGAVAGALATLALAPRAGSDTRDRLRSRIPETPGDELRSRASHLREAALERSEKLREAATSSEVVQSTRSKVTDLVDRSPLPVTLGDDAGDAVDDAAETFSEQAERAEGAVADAASELAERDDQVLEETTGPVGEGSEDDTEDKPGN